MNIINTNFYTVPDYVFGSPRYNCLRNFEELLIPNQYGLYDGLNGTADKYYPCYTLTSNSEPSTIILDSNGQEYPNTGAFSYRQYQNGIDIKEVGAQDEPVSLANSNLNQYYITRNKYFSTKANPGWCTIQTIESQDTPESDITYTPQYLVRSLGNEVSATDLYALDLDEEDILNMLGSSTSFLPGDIVKYNDRTYKCVLETTTYPPNNELGNNYWLVLSYGGNVFNADVFACSYSSSAYMLEINDPDRYFNPTSEDSDSLVAWSVAYYHN